MRAWIGVSFVVAACGPSGDKACKDKIVPGDLVITEVFADFKAPAGGSGGDTGKEWFEIYNAADHPIELSGLTITHSRRDGSKANSHTMTDVTIDVGQYLTLGNSTPDLLPPYVHYGYSNDLGDFFNTDGGKLALDCGGTEIDSATYDNVKAGHSRQLTAAQPPDYTLNDDPANWCDGDLTEFDAGNFGTPGQDNDCTPVLQGMCNDGGTMRATVTPMPGDLVITEVMPSPTKVSDTTGEWFEAKAIHDVDLNGVGLDRAGDTAKPDVITSTDCIHVAAGGYALFAKSTDTTMNGGLPAPIAGTFKFSIISGSATAPGDVQIVVGTTVIDAITWTTSTNGKALQLDPDLTDPISNDDPANFCDATMPYGAGDLGTPAADNGQCTALPPPGECLDNGAPRPIVKPTAGQLVITEVMANPKVEPAQEWFEITNTGAAAFDLNELGLDRAGDTRDPDVIHAADCKSVAPGGFALFARSADPATNGMLPPPDATFGFSLVNSAGDVQVLDGTTVLDAVTYATTTDGVALQLDPDHFTTADNDVAANFCAATAPYGDMTNQGTPGAANAPCP
jgi:hypothetical protein